MKINCEESNGRYSPYCCCLLRISILKTMKICCKSLVQGSSFSLCNSAACSCAQMSISSHSSLFLPLNLSELWGTSKRTWTCGFELLVFEPIGSTHHHHFWVAILRTHLVGLAESLITSYVVLSWPYFLNKILRTGLLSMSFILDLIVYDNFLSGL